MGLQRARASLVGADIPHAHRVVLRAGEDGIWILGMEANRIYRAGVTLKNLRERKKTVRMEKRKNKGKDAA